MSRSTPAHGEEEASSTTYTYNGFNQLIALTVDGTSVAYAYNAQGIRTAKRVNNLRTAFLLDGGNVIAEVQSNTVTDSYLRSVNLVRRESNSETEYYRFNAHGDVVTTTNLNGTVNQEYDYDAFGNEKDPDDLDSNPFRYCGEYLDAETGDYYLRARYYDPTIGRFTQQDTHWNTANMIYGDNPQKINTREDILGLRTYTMVPQISAVGQSGNLYVNCINDPANYNDASGKFIIGGLTVTLGLVLAGAFINTVTTVAGALLTDQKLTGYDVAVAAITGAAAGFSIANAPLAVAGIAGVISALYTGYTTWKNTSSLTAGIVCGLAAGVGTFMNISTFAIFPTTSLQSAAYLFENAVSCTGNNLTTAAICKIAAQPQNTLIDTDPVMDTTETHCLKTTKSSTRRMKNNQIDLLM